MAKGHFPKPPFNLGGARVIKNKTIVWPRARGSFLFSNIVWPRAQGISRTLVKPRIGVLVHNCLGPSFNINYRIDGQSKLLGKGVLEAY